jgi:hypothetical protein
MGTPDEALSFFNRTPEVYRADGSLALAELYLGLSICLMIDASGRLQSASDLIRLGLDGGARVPHGWRHRRLTRFPSGGRTW